MKLLYNAVKNLPKERQTAEDRAMIETYNKKVNFIDFSSLDKIITEAQKWRQITIYRLVWNTTNLFIFCKNGKIGGIGGIAHFLIFKNYQKILNKILCNISIRLINFINKNFFKYKKINFMI